LANLGAAVLAVFLFRKIGQNYFLFIIYSTSLDMEKRLLTKLLVVALIACLAACSDNGKTASTTQKKVTKIFNKIAPEKSGVAFSNTLREDSIINYFTYPYIYMGGGVAVGDVNNDGLQDLYFTGNMVDNRLYINKGEMQFEDITEVSKTAGDNRWVTGATIADVNADGWADIYVSVSGKFTTTKNQLFLNDGLNENGIPTFTESAEQAGIADEGHSTQGTFFDYDKDGDLDLYVANYPFTSFKTRNFSYQYLIQQKSPDKSDRLYRNRGDGTFDDVTEQSGILNFGLSLSATAGDMNGDGWDDIYVSNDFATPDYFYLNNGDGTFTNQIKEVTQHTAYFGMGTDIGDFNNDGLLDLVQMDMTPKSNRRSKANMASMNPAGFWEMVEMGMHFQYMQNALQLNQGITNDGLPHFSDVSRLAGMSSTDWSWAGLFADLDNDGWKDVFVTNGTRRDINNKDYFHHIDNAKFEEKQHFNNLDLTKKMPSEKIDNYAFRNNGDLTFENVIDKWGLGFVGYSNGAAYSDLDNDGDLDMIVNNIDDPVAIYQNLTSDEHLANFLDVKLKGSAQNPMGLGTKVVVSTTAGEQYQQLTLTRGFQSSVCPVIHFGLGSEDVVEKVTITWPDGKQQQLEQVPVNQVLEADYKSAAEPGNSQPMANSEPQFFQDVTEELGIQYKHIENPYNDFEYEVLLPHAYSANGPGLAVADVNGDGLEDFYVGAAISGTGVLYLQTAGGTFETAATNPWASDSDREDMDAVFFDADGDGDQDLYVVSGGNEHDKDSDKLQDRLYLNDGTGNFTKSENSLPQMIASGSRVKVADYDKDGDLDLFVGGRIVPKSYPLPAKSFILRNDGSENGVVKFSDATAEAAPMLTEAGLVTDAAWTDFDGDGQLDLVVVGEWMPLTFLKNSGGKFTDKTEEFGLAKTTGWWYSIAAGDFDNDGDEDLVAGNLGLNYKYRATPEESFDVYVNDYDKNGKLDIVLGYYNDGVQYPVRGKQCSSEQIPAIKFKFKDYNSFADATLADIYTEHDLEASKHYQAWDFASSYIENKGNGHFEVTKLPNEAQLSAINAIVAEDVNKDGNLDLVVAGNLFAAEVETPRGDASYGQLLQGDGKGHFSTVPFSKTGLFLKNCVKDLAKINTKKGPAILVANNSEYLKAILINESASEVQ